ncbi:ATP-dependent metallopeptidase FtsH/Yme1/Tma family protein [Paratissierella segnis]|jgi:cell division protease FtsH|uniref:ATP-dependent zinc metalloprotease FtsH n=1 Tax=Paratissierella segnis TaxID=2763679 RepID=A0A926EYB8_9FIRM|nr:ATP-dependent metallopeptidase FtsH/Yme1/Tma family protein [Paratissierella segnis]MBC8588757.1 ATP-dependent metallopeptidase FtsH/Yme1/Tma family protein [Paratissierella segnis]
MLITITALSSILVFQKNKSKTEEIAYTTFVKYLENKDIEEVYLGNNAKIKVILKDGREMITDNPRTADFKKDLLLHDIKVVEKTNSLDTFGLPIILMLFLLSILIYFNKNISKQAEKEMANMSNIDSEDSNAKVTFDDIAGNDEAKEALKEMVDFIQRPEIYREYGARLPRGVLLYGPPGTGKTLLAKALANEAKVPFFAVAGSDFVQVYAGLGASRIRDLFKKAKEAGKSVIFIDEIDSIGKKRKGSSVSGSEEGDRTLNALLAEMSGFKENEGIIVIAATNRVDVLDEALLRPGRFDRQVEVALPDVNARFQILKLHGKNKPIARNIDFKRLANETVYFSGAKLENLLNEAAMIAVKEKSDTIKNEHIDKAYYKVLVGDEKIDRSYINQKDKEITAYHEAGHALVAKKVDKGNRVTKVSIIPSTKGVGGFSLNLPSDKIYRTKKDILSNIMVALGGRAAEEIVFGKNNITTGASSDLEKATEYALSMIGNFGMDEDYGLVNYNVLLSNDIKENSILMERTKKILENLYQDTINLLNNSKEELENITKALLLKETINEDELNSILNH